MTRFMRILLGSLALIGLIAATLAQATGVQAAQGGAKSGQLSFHGHTLRGPLGVSHTFSKDVGIPAIHPRTVSSSPTTPNFTAEDVQAYLLTASQPDITPVQGAHLSTERVLFVSDSEATQLMQGEDPGLPDDAQVCFVQLKGPFHVQVDQAPGTRASTDPIATEVGVVFDAHTGNLLEWGILDSLPGSSPSQEKPSAQSPAPSISYSCSPNRCWGVNYWPNPVNGAYSLLNWPYPDVTRFYYGTGTAFVQNTIWLVDETEPNNCYADPRDLPSDCWVEAGLRAYEENGSNVTGLFWADLRPGYNYADHYGPLVNTLNSTWGIEIQIFKAGTVPAAGWCPTASYTWCVDLYSEGDGQELTAISGAGHTNRMKVSGYREGLELLGLSGAVANPMQFDVNQWESTSDNSWNFQDNVGTIGKYTSNPPVEDYWDVEPQFSNSGGTWVTCITGAGC